MNKQIHLTYDKNAFDELLESMPENGIKGMLGDYHTMEVNMQHAVGMEYNKKLQKKLDKTKKKLRQLQEFKQGVNDAIENEAEKKELHQCLLKMMNVIKNDISTSTNYHDDDHDDDNEDKKHKEQINGKLALFIKTLINHAYVRC